MSDNFWQDIRDTIYDAMSDEFYTEEERDQIIEDSFDGFAGFSTDIGSIPLNFTSRQHTFYSPIDLTYWVEDAGIPIEYVYVHRLISKRSNSDAYQAFVSNSP